MNTRILVTLDGSEFAEQALEAVKRFSTQVGSCSIEVLYVIDPAPVADIMPAGVMPPDYFEREQAWAQDYVDEKAALLAGPRVEAHGVVSIGPPAQAVLDRIDAGQFDYVFMATHGRSGLKRAIVGSVTERVIRESPVPVVAVHARPKPAAQNPWPGQDAPAQALIALLGRQDALARDALEVLVERGSAVVPELLQALTSGSSDVRQLAARAMGRIRDRRAIPALLEQLDNEVFEVRWEAAMALARFGEAGAEAVLGHAISAKADMRLNMVLLQALDNAPVHLISVLKPVKAALRSREHAMAVPVAAEKALEQLRRQHIAV